MLLAKGQEMEGGVAKDGRGSAAGKSYGGYTGYTGIGAGRGTACGAKGKDAGAMIAAPAGRGVGGGVACGNDELGRGLAKGAGVGNGRG